VGSDGDGQVRISEYLRQHPELDPEMDNFDEGDILVDGVYLFRITRMDESSSEAALYFMRSDHTDSIVMTGLIVMADEMMEARRKGDPDV
jgi:hypothetical protein